MATSSEPGTPETGMTATVIKRRTPIRDQIRSILRSRILCQELKPGTRLNESALAEEFQVSRGPIREALGSLAQEGFLHAEPGRGYFITELSPRELRELFVVLADLETLAIQKSEVFGAGQLARLDALNEELDGTRSDPSQAPEVNLRWHMQLVSSCRNKILLDLLGSLRRQAYRYEYAFFADPVHVADSVGFHRSVIESLRSGDAEAAAMAIRRHWTTDLDFLKVKGLW